MTYPSTSVSLTRPEYANGKHLAQQIFLETLATIDVRNAMLSKLVYEDDTLRAGEISFPLFRPPRVIAIGKAASRMAAVLGEILGGRVEAGVVVVMSGCPVVRLAVYEVWSGWRNWAPSA